MSLMGLAQSLFLVGMQQRQSAMSVVFQECVFVIVRGPSPLIMSQDTKIFISVRCLIKISGVGPMISWMGQFVIYRRVQFWLSLRQYIIPPLGENYFCYSFRHRLIFWLTTMILFCCWSAQLQNQVRALSSSLLLLRSSRRGHQAALLVLQPASAASPPH